MHLFVSWSGPRSLEVAKGLRGWIGQLFDEIKVWISPDIPKGEDWLKEITQQLDSTNYGIACITSDNRSSQWLHLEVGYLRGRRIAVTGFLLDIEPRDLIPGPLQHLNHTRFDHDDLFALTRQINEQLRASGGRALSENNLVDLFERRWPSLSEIRGKAMAIVPFHTDRHTLHEILARVTAMQRSIFGVPVRSETAIHFGTDDYYAPRVASLEEMVKLVKDPKNYEPPPSLGSPNARRGRGTSSPGGAA